MQLEEDFGRWLHGALADQIPSEVIAFVFNLFEPACVDNAKFGIEIIGTRSFDPSNPDWATDEVWEPRARRLLLPFEFTGDNWEHCLEKVTTLVKTVIQGTSPASMRLRSRIAVAIGFVDGELAVLWEAPREA